MGKWSKYSADEMERRRAASVKELRRMDDAAWQVKYQQTCDALYWEFGPCCGGCDHWDSSEGLTGGCSANGLVSGADVLRSMDISFSSYMPPPGFPATKAKFRCGKFKDDFDWQSLPAEYLKSIGYRPDRIPAPPPPQEDAE
ncbi:hypothetical protein [Cypionkella sp. TWP1-2-1b2]|uniref:hypothetical protein n=1 Tax=Cypionkella sp. TWP1-2-1b2 TaxID=2804675 RepID=UPI003CF4F98B